MEKEGKKTTTKSEPLVPSTRILAPPTLYARPWDGLGPPFGWIGSGRPSNLPLGLGLEKMVKVHRARDAHVEQTLLIALILTLSQSDMLNQPSG